MAGWRQSRKGAASLFFMEDLAWSLPCVRGGAAQRRWGCGAGPISRSRATTVSLQPLRRLRRQLPLHRGAFLYPGKGPRLSGRGRVSCALAWSLPCVRGGAAQRRWGCGAGPISRSRATTVSLQPLRRLRRQLPLHRGAFLYPGKGPRLSGRGRVSCALAWSLPCVRGGAAQRRWGCGAGPISRSRATTVSLQPLRRLRRQLPLHRGAFLYLREPFSTP